MNIVDIIGSDRNIIPYRPELRKIAGTINATILLQQMIYYCSGSKDNKFYKFRAPCSHENYRDGDSWTEKLGFSLDEFDSALSKIAFKLGNCKNKLSKEEALVHYYTDKQRYTWYSVNMEQLEKQLSSLYLVNGESQDIKVNRESQFTKKMEKPNLLNNLENPIYPVNRETPITIHTEINYKEEIHKEEVADFSNFSKNEKEDSEKPAETFFQKEFDELKEYFSESEKEKTNSTAKTENKVEMENLPNFEIQSKEIEVFSKETSKSEKSKEIFFSETNYFSDEELFSQEFMKRFPKYEKYDLEHYRNALINWGQGKKILKYKKTDWILTAKTWIDTDVTKGVATLKWQTKPLQSQKINTMGDLIDQEQRVNDFLIIQERQKQQEKQTNGTNGTYTHSYELIS